MAKRFEQDWVYVSRDMLEDILAGRQEDRGRLDALEEATVERWPTRGTSIAETMMDALHNAAVASGVAAEMPVAKPILRDRNGTELHEGDWVKRVDRFDVYTVGGKFPSTGGQIGIESADCCLLCDRSTVILWKRLDNG